MPTVVLAIGALIGLEGALGVAVALGVFVLGTAVLMALVLHPNASAWTETAWRARRETNQVALTFDDGPDPSTTLEIARLLEERSVRAAFFVVGDRVRAHPEVVAQLHETGHLVCNHSDTHAMTFHFGLWGTLRRELRACNEAIAAVVGREPLLFRSPQGIKTPPLGDVLRELGLTAVGWQVRGLDAFGADADAIARRVLRDARPGGVIMLHDATPIGGTSDGSATIEALPHIIDGLRERGLQLARLDELLELAPYRSSAP